MPAECVTCGREFDSQRGCSIHETHVHGSGNGIEDADLLEGLRAMADDLGRPPTGTEMEADGPYSKTAYRNHFGTWTEALAAADLAPTDQTTCPVCGETFDTKHGRQVHEGRRHANGPSRDELLSDLRQVAEQFGRAPSHTEMRDHGEFSPDTYHRRFGSWTAACEEAGFVEQKHPGDAVGRDSLLEALRTLADDLGRPPRQSEMATQGEYSTTPYYREFDSWLAALREAGFEPDPADYDRRGIPDEDLLAELQRLADELGHSPRATDMERDGRYAPAVYTQRFDGWIAAQRAAGIEPTRAAHGEADPVHGYRGSWNESRRRALARDQARCQDCGVAEHRYCAEQGHGLDVHHIVPYRSFDDPEAAHELENLVTLCRSCHAARHTPAEE